MEKLLLFDIGGVLVKNNSFNDLQNYTDIGFTIDEFKDKWIKSENVRNFESGKINIETFSNGFIDEFSLNLNQDKLIEVFESWVDKPFEGVFDLLTKLRKKYFLGCLSNSNSIHWDKLQRAWNFFEYFDCSFSSHLVGCLKPDKIIFEKILESVPHKIEDIIFFDDTYANVKAADEFGIKSYFVKNHESLVELLNKKFL